MITSVNAMFPPELLCTVEVARQVTDRKGNRRPDSQHSIDDCLVATQSTAEDVPGRSDDPDTTAWLTGPVGADLRQHDIVTVPAGPRPSGQFRVVGDVEHYPLGSRARLERN